MSMVWWHWMLVGIFLLLLELLFPSFPLVWFGLGGLLMGIIVALCPDFNVIIQASVWAVFSVSFTLLWRKYLKPKKEQTLRHHNIIRR